MNVLFLSLGTFNSIYEKGIYTDLLREFIKNGHQITILSSQEERNNNIENEIIENNSKIIKVYTGKIQKTNIIEKGINTLLIEIRYKNAIKKYLNKETFDLIIYPTPPITFCNAIKYVKQRDNASTYLLLKDIFPQNAVDIGMLSESGLKGLIYKYFKLKEKKLYNISDYIGCMSPANVKYLLKHNPDLSVNNVEVCPNSIEFIDKSVNYENRVNIRKKYNLPLDKKIYIYGGNLGKPQGIDFLIKCIDSQKENEDVFFLIVGDGVEYHKLKKFKDDFKQKNFMLLQRLPKEDYDTMVGACDVGMIFLDNRFTIPNFPSRLLSYMQAKIPVLVCTDKNTDIGDIAVEGEFGWKCYSDDINDFELCLKKACVSDLSKMGENAMTYLIKNYDVKQGYKIIIKHFDE